MQEEAKKVPEKIAELLCLAAKREKQKYERKNCVLELVPKRFTEFADQKDPEATCGIHCAKQHA